MLHNDVRPRLTVSLFVALLVVMPVPGWAAACPFCAATSQTLSEEMAAADVVILANILEVPQAPKPSDEPGAGPGSPSFAPTKFRVVQVIKGQTHLAGADQIEATFFGEPKPDSSFLITGQVLPGLQWATPIPLNPRAVSYVNRLLQLPEKGHERLVFFQEYLEDKDSILSQDAYDEFARAPYDDVKDLKEDMHHDRLIAWIRDTEVSPSHRRLYLTMLGVCGTADDLPMLEEMIKSEDRASKSGLDALIACYLTLRGPDGMPLIEDLFLKKSQAEYADTYAAIMAIRFHGQEADIIPKERLLVGLRHMLDRPELADLVISDLARWEDWSVMDRLIRLFKESDGESSWVRVPVVNFLQQCGRQQNDVGRQALAAIDELAKIDPVAVKQARSYAAFGVLGGATSPAATQDTKIAPAAAPVAEPVAEPAKASDEPAVSGAKPEPKTEVAPADRPTGAAERKSEAAAAPPAADSTTTGGGNKLRIAMLIAIGAAILVVLKLTSRRDGHLVDDAT